MDLSLDKFEYGPDPTLVGRKTGQCFDGETPVILKLDWLLGSMPLRFSDVSIFRPAWVVYVISGYLSPP